MRRVKKRARRRHNVQTPKDDPSRPIPENCDLFEALHESQIVGVRPEKREGDTLRLSATPPAEPVAPDTLPLLEPARSKAAFATAGGVEQLPRAQSQGRSVWPVAAAGLALAVAGAVGIEASCIACRSRARRASRS